MNETYDTCRYCCESKPVSKFKKDKNSPRGYTRMCNSCNSKAVQEANARKARNNLLIALRERGIKA